MTAVYYGDRDLDRAVAAIGMHDDLAVLSSAQSRVLAQAVFESADVRPVPAGSTDLYLMAAAMVENWRTRSVEKIADSPEGHVRALIDAAVDAGAIGLTGPVTGSTTDGFHTFDELYLHRLLLSSALWNGWANDPAGTAYGVHRSLRHHDGTVPFPDEDGNSDWFIVVAQLPAGQISYHYQLEHWDLFASVPQRGRAEQWDGHTSLEVTDRLREYLTGGHLPIGPDWGVRFSPSSDPVTFESEGAAREWLASQGCPPPLMHRDPRTYRWEYADEAPLWAVLQSTGHLLEFAHERGARRYAAASTPVSPIVMQRVAAGAAWHESRAAA